MESAIATAMGVQLRPAAAPFSDARPDGAMVRATEEGVPGRFLERGNRRALMAVGAG